MLDLKNLGLRPSFDSVDQLRQIKRDWQINEQTQCDEFVDWLLSAEFDEQNFYLGELISPLLDNCEVEALDLIGEKCADANPWAKAVYLCCLKCDFSNPHLLQLAEECASSDIVELRESGLSTCNEIKSVRGRAKKILDACMREIRADSYTFFVPNPPPANNHQLYLSRGIRYSEAIDGLTLDFSSVEGRRAELDPDPELTCIVGRLAGNEKLFQGFCDREGIEKSEQFEINICGRKAAVFFNFRSKPKFDVRNDPSVLHAMREIEQILPKVVDDARFSKRELEKLMAMQQFIYVQDASTYDNVVGFLARALRGCLEVMRLPVNDTLATFSLYDETTISLPVVACTGDSRRLEKHPHMSAIDDGVGILSWVALMKRSIRISDLGSSAFNAIFVPGLDGAESVLTVPVLAGKKLRGVINFETRVSNAFSPRDLLLIWEFGKFVGAQLESKRSAGRQFHAIRKTLAEQEKISLNLGEQDRLDRMAELARQLLRSDHVDIWTCDAGGKFRAGGSTVPNWNLNSKPRTIGWTSYVYRSQGPVFVYDTVGGCEGFAVVDDIWQSVGDGPSVVHDSIVGKIKCELGIPVFSAGKVVAVIWLKYVSATPLPMPEDLNLAQYFAEKSSEFSLLKFAA